MSRGITIADFVQQVLYAVYKVRLETREDKDNTTFHAESDKFKEVVMEANFTLQRFQKEQDWNFLRERWEIGRAANFHGQPGEYQFPKEVYKLCTGYGDAVRLHRPGRIYQIPFEEARTGNREWVEMFNEWGEMNVNEHRQAAFTVGDVLAFKRPWFPHEVGGFLETDVIRYIEPLHICDDSCKQPCPKTYEELQFTWMPDPYYFVVQTAVGRAQADPSCVEMVQVLTDEATKMLSAMRENDSAHTTTDTYETTTLGYVPVL